MKDGAQKCSSILTFEMTSTCALCKDAMVMNLRMYKWKNLNTLSKKDALLSIPR